MWVQTPWGVFEVKSSFFMYNTIFVYILRVPVSMKGSKGHQMSRKQRKQTGFKELAHICVLCSAIASPSLLSSSPIRVNPRGTATRVFRVRSVRAWGTSTGSRACALAGRRCSLWVWRKGVPGAGAFHRCEGRLRSGAPPPPTARPLGGLLGSATHMLWARVCGCGGPTPTPWPACPVGAAC